MQFRSAGWVAFITFSAVASWCGGCGIAGELYSQRLVEWHFWMRATLDYLSLYRLMWVAGILQ